MNEWNLIPEDRIKAYLNEHYINNGIVVCKNCGLVEVVFIPYAYDKLNNEVIHIGKCPKCGEIMYVKD